MTSGQLDEERIFHIARELSNLEARSNYLDQICAGDQALRERVEGLLEVHEQEQSFLKSDGAVEPTIDQSPIAEGPGQQIGRYKLLQKIGEGGFGVVYMAEQSRPVRRKVALKIIKPGMDTHAVVARFEAERQALAMMDHVNIARVLDGGATESGRPYFVMELVKGVPITEYCDKNQLATEERLKLFMTICQAVQHAHQKGIIHRDLKPSNVLVTLADGEPIVKVIDFGVAKATNQQLTEKTLFTAYGQMIGTPQYMSPEQAEMSCLDVDTRSDVYSLGVLLYELLTGTTPLEAEKLRTAGYVEMQRMIREDEPPKPSTRLSTSGEKLTVIAKHRAASPERLKSEVQGDLDWIVMKSLEKDRNRRYESPGSFAIEVRRLLNNEPIDARPPSRSYRIAKFVKRNRGLAMTTATTTLALLVAVTGLAVGLLRANQRLSQLRENAVRESIIAALGADETRARAALENAIAIGAPEGDTALIEGILSLNQGDYQRALEFAEQAQRLDSDAQGKDRVGALSVRANAYYWSGRLDLSDVDGHLLSGRQAKAGVESLLHAYALVGINPEQSWRILDKDLNKAESRSPLGLFIKGQAGVMEAIDKHDLVKLQEAIRRLEISREDLLGDSPATIGWLLDAYAAAIDRYRADGNQVAVAEYTAKGLKIAKEYGDNPFFAWAVWLFYRAVGDPKGAAKACQLAREEGETFFVATDCLLKESGVGALSRFDSTLSPDHKNFKFYRIARAHLLLRVGDIEEVDEAKDGLIVLLDDPSALVRRQALMALCVYLRVPEIRSLATKALNESNLENPTDVWRGEEGVRFLADPNYSPKAFTNMAREHRFTLADAWFTIAMLRVADRDRDGVESALEKCQAALATGTMDYELACAYLYRMQSDETWVPWRAD